MTGPAIITVVYGAHDDDNPFMTVIHICRACREVTSWRVFDCRLQANWAELGEVDGLTDLAHLGRHG